MCIYNIFDANIKINATAFYVYKYLVLYVKKCNAVYMTYLFLKLVRTYVRIRIHVYIIHNAKCIFSTIIRVQIL